MDSAESTWSGKDKLFHGVWCIKDEGSTEYATLASASQTAVSWKSQESYGHNMVYFCVVCIAVFIVKRMVYLFVDRNSQMIRASSNSMKRWYYEIAAINRWVCYRRFPSFVCNAFQLPSSMGNFLVIMGGCLYMLCYTFIPKFWYRGCRGFGSPPLAVRAGLESTALVPFIFITSGKTNLISQLTDISYEKLNVYHRWISTMCCLLGWVHTIPFYVQAVQEGGGARLAWFQRTEDEFVNGIPPLVFLTVLTVFSHSYIRARWYELWLQIHWVCALGFYISLFYHCYPSLNSWKYMVATIVFWFSQLLWRAVNKGMLRPNKGFMKPNRCKMRRFGSSGENDHYFEIVVSNSNDFSWAAGQHVFIKVPGLRCIESHPFSIVSYFEARESTDIKLIIKTIGWGGMTRFLYDKLPDSGYSESNIYIDGPYGGCSRQVGSFDSVFLVASGTGISAILPFLHEACEAIGSGKQVTQTVRLDWVIRDPQNIEWIIPELKKIVNAHAEIFQGKRGVVNVFISEDLGFTSKEALESLKTERLILPSSSESDLEEKSVGERNVGLEAEFIHVVNEKPKIGERIEETRGELQRRNMFIVSGSDSAKVQASNAIAKLQTEVFNRGRDVEEIYLHSESFGW